MSLDIDVPFEFVCGNDQIGMKVR